MPVLLQELRSLPGIVGIKAKRWTAHLPPSPFHRVMPTHRSSFDRRLLVGAASPYRPQRVFRSRLTELESTHTGNLSMLSDPCEETRKTHPSDEKSIPHGLPLPVADGHRQDSGSVSGGRWKSSSPPRTRRPSSSRRYVGSRRQPAFLLEVR